MSWCTAHASVTAPRISRSQSAKQANNGDGIAWGLGLVASSGRRRATARRLAAEWHLQRFEINLVPRRRVVLPRLILCSLIGREPAIRTVPLCELFGRVPRKAQ